MQPQDHGRETRFICRGPLDHQSHLIDIYSSCPFTSLAGAAAFGAYRDYFLWLMIFRTRRISALVADGSVIQNIIIITTFQN